MTMLLLLPVVSILCCMLLVSVISAAKVGDTVCVQGYPMDMYCITDGFLFDNPGVVTLEEPQKHSVHCLLDVSSCVTSAFEILTPPNTTAGEKLYKRAYRFDSATKTKVITLAKKVGICTDCTPGGTIRTGLYIVVNGTIVTAATTTIPAIVSGNVVALANSSSISSICTGNTNPSNPVATTTKAPASAPAPVKTPVKVITPVPVQAPRPVPKKAPSRPTRRPRRMIFPWLMLNKKK